MLSRGAKRHTLAGTEMCAEITQSEVCYTLPPSLRSAATVVALALVGSSSCVVALALVGSSSSCVVALALVGSSCWQQRLEDEQQ